MTLATAPHHEIAQPENVHPSSIQAETTVSPAREPVKAPEGLAPAETTLPPAPPVVHRHEPHVAPTEHHTAEHHAVAHAAKDSHMPHMGAHVAPAAPFTHAVFVAPEKLTAAEKVIATYLASTIDAKLIDGLVLTLGSAPNQNSTDLKLYFEGPALAANGALLLEEVAKALHTHPAFAHLSAESKKFHAHKTDGVENLNKLRIDVPHLDNGAYAKLINTLAAPAKTTPTLADQPAVSEVQPAVQPVAALAEVPSNIIAAPAANAQTLAPAPQLANGAVI